MQLTKTQQILLVTLSFLIVAFGQPYWSKVASFLATTVGFGLFFRLLISFESKKQRFCIATGWFLAVQLVQFTWFLSHPYLYIIAVYTFISLLYALPFGCLGILAKPTKITALSRIVLIVSCWTLLEWSRLFLLSGIAFNPIGLSLSANLYTLQTAALWGAFGMSFWVLWVNMLGLKAWLEVPKIKSLLLWLACAAFPFVFGFVQFKIHQTNTTETFNAVLIQPVFPIEENMEFKDSAAYVKFVRSEWEQILKLSKPHLDKKVDLIALPEFVVPFSTYTPLFHYRDVEKIFIDVYGSDKKNHLPLLQEPIAKEYNTPQGPVWMVSNAYWLQGLANMFNAPVIAGMMDVVDVYNGTRESYSSAQFVCPERGIYAEWPPFKRYDKRILVPMGEYIPFSFCRSIAAQYGISGSFTPGQNATIFSAKVPLGVSICYEETFGHLMRETRLNGAQLLVNLTSDIWYPTIAQQHCDHARLRTTENGIPLVRACNTGITTAFDSFGQEIQTLGQTHEEKIWNPGALYVEIPKHSYPTIYSILGDYLILAISLIGLTWGWYKE
ncbi:MAG: apolipoprotein N-acyltransferase [Chlamydiales bacterium 38-26]|nr:apolipoprotein N-acyltransferase [Chlamydiales bacterium]OJV07906.1 MAG: apolipoprotein N-acyltransferase [Chlamydiales bacterium 38-26]